MKYRRNPLVVDAVQFNHIEDWPVTEHRIWYSCDFCEPFMNDIRCCEHCQMHNEYCFPNKNTWIYVKISNYILSYPDGYVDVITKQEFDKDWTQCGSCYYCEHFAGIMMIPSCNVKECSPCLKRQEYILNEETWPYRLGEE